MRFTSQHKAINQKEYGKAVSPLRYDSLALILSWSIFVVYGKQSEKNKYFCSSKRHSALHTFWDTTHETVARRRSASLLSEFGLGHVREYAPFALILLCVPGALRAPCCQRLASHPSCKVSAHFSKCARMALRATLSF